MQFFYRGYLRTLVSADIIGLSTSMTMFAQDGIILNLTES
jgi:hypothetical protein